MSLTTPILFLIFNRPDTTALVFEAIKKQQPKYLYIAADGPRTGKEGEAEKCMQTRELVLKGIDWSCEVKTLLRNENLGCGKAVSSAITWFFDLVEEGIILEDDCLPDFSFFRFCEELLEKYKNEEKIISICGTNVHSSFSDTNSYIYSLYAGIWGWASWRRSWKQYDYDMSGWKKPDNQKIVRKNLQSNKEYLGIKNIFDSMVSNDVKNTWDIQWFYNSLLNNQMTIFPTKNLIQNIGFGNFATHTLDQNSELSQIELFNMSFPMVHPESIKPNRKFDRATSIKYGWYIKYAYGRALKNKIISLIGKNQMVYKLMKSSYQIFHK